MVFLFLEAHVSISFRDILQLACLCLSLVEAAQLLEKVSLVAEAAHVRRHRQGQAGKW